MTSPSDLPRITKRELARVGVELTHEENVRDWMRRGWLALEAHLWAHRKFYDWGVERVFEEDGA